MASRSTKAETDADKLTSKKPAYGKRRGSKKTGGTSYQKKTQSKEFGTSIKDEIILILIILASILVLISLFTSKMGVVGGALQSFFRGMFGFGSWILPTIVILFCIWMLTSENKQWIALKIGASILFLICVSAIFHCISGPTVLKEGFFTKWSIFYTAGSMLNGGAVGGMIGQTMTDAFGNIGTYLILLSLIVISVMMGTGKSFFQGIASFYSILEERHHYHNEKIKLKADHIRQSEQKRQVKKTKAAEKKKRKKNSFDIQLKQEEGYHEKSEDEPIIEAMVFEKKRKNQTTKKQAQIYDFNQELAKVNDWKPKEEFVPFIHDSLDAKKEDTYLEQMQEEVSEEEPLIKQTDFEVKQEVSEETKQSKQENLEQPKQESVYSEKDENAPVSEEEKESYVFPPVDLLGKNTTTVGTNSKMEMLSNARKLEETLKSFGVEAKVIQINRGPTVTRYEISPSQGIKVSKIVSLADDIALNLAANGIRIEAPIPGKAAVGIEIPNKEAQSVFFRDVLDTEEFQNFPSKLAFALGEDITGKAVVADIARMPHLLIAGATGSGKSVCINTLITSILYKAKPEEVKLLLIDPKVVELSIYNGVPHLIIPVVTDPKKAAGALNWAVKEMLSRYQTFAEHNVRDISGYNAMKQERGESDFMPKIVIIIDELADLMMAAPGEVEDSICRLAQMARAAGLHLIIATQRPSTDVITGVIKANIPSRLAFSVSSGVDSRTILNMVGAEKLLGKGDMLFYPVGTNKPVRIQGAFVTDKEVENIVEFVRNQSAVEYDEKMMEEITSLSNSAEFGEECDELYMQALELVVAKQKASASMLQRQFRIGYNRAARLMEELEQRGMVGPEEGSKPRKVLMTIEELEDYKNRNKIKNEEEY